MRNQNDEAKARPNEFKLCKDEEDEEAKMRNQNDEDNVKQTVSDFSFPTTRVLMWPLMNDSTMVMARPLDETSRELSQK